MYHQFNVQQFHVLPTQCIYVFCVDLRTNSEYFPVQLVFITETECVYCAVRSGSLNITYVCFQPESSKIFSYTSRDFVLRVSGFAVFVRKHQKISFDLRAGRLTTIGVCAHFVAW